MNNREKIMKMNHMNAQSMRRQLKKEIEDKELTPFSINKGGKNKASTFLEDT